MVAVAGVSGYPSGRSGYLAMRAERLVLAGYWMDKAHESVRAARVLLGANIVSASMSRLYYAVFYAVSALFIARGVKYSKHSAIQAAFHRDLVRPGTVPKDMGALYDRMSNARQEGDYKAFTNFGLDDVTAELVEVERFVQLFHALLREEEGRFEE